MQLLSTIAGESVGGRVGYAVRLDARATRLESSFLEMSTVMAVGKVQQFVG